MPANKDEIHLYDEGTAFVITFQEWNEETEVDEIVDISQATQIRFYFKKLDTEEVITKIAAKLSDGTDGKAVYLTTATDLDVTGKWELQGRVALPAGEWSSNIELFEVFPNLWQQTA